MPQVVARRSRVCVNLHAPRYQTPGTAGDVIGNHQVALLNLCVKLLVICALEWELSAEESEQQHARCIDISRWPTEFRLGHYLWRHVTWCSAEYFDPLLVGDAGREAEINQFHVSLLVQHNIFQLDVSVRDAFIVEVAQSMD